MTVVRHIGEIGIGLLFLVGAIFNLSYTLRHGEEFFGGFAKNPWLPPAGKLVTGVVIPNAAIFTVMLIALQLTAAALILSRGGLVPIGLYVGAAFAVFAALFSNVGGALANLALGALQFLLAIAR